jgi:hypothetical protein
VYKVSIDQLNWAAAHKRSGGKTWVVTELDDNLIVFLDFDDRMSDCSTLGVYLRRYKPFTLTLENWLAEIQLSTPKTGIKHT